MSVPERDLDKKAASAYIDWLSRKLIGKGSGKGTGTEEWLATCLLTLLMPGPDAKDPPPKPKDDPKDDWTVRSADREILKARMIKTITVMNDIVDVKREAARLAGKDPDKVGEKIDLDAIKKEWDAGKFGPKSVAALKKVTEFLSVGTVQHLKVLDAMGLDIPAGCPLEPPLDPSGRHIGDELFRAKLAKDEIKFDLLKKPLEEGKLPDTDFIVRLAKADAFITECQEILKSASIRADAGRLLLEI
ncbi:MAG: hypothetical protein C5B53_02330, partial [Candidatus Melainabacteria bacterium]